MTFPLGYIDGIGSLIESIANDAKSACLNVIAIDEEICHRSKKIQAFERYVIALRNALNGRPNLYAAELDGVPIPSENQPETLLKLVANNANYFGIVGASSVHVAFILGVRLFKIIQPLFPSLSLNSAFEPVAPNAPVNSEDININNADFRKLKKYYKPSIIGLPSETEMQELLILIDREAVRAKDRLKAINSVTALSVFPSEKQQLPTQSDAVQRSEPRKSVLAEAVAVLARNPKFTNRQVAQAVNCNEKYLSQGDNIFKQARIALKLSNRPPKGSKSKDGIVEAYEDE